MPIPSYGAAPLSKTFVLVRAMQVISMIAIVGMTANFVSEIIQSGVEPPKEIVALYVLISVAFFWSEANIGLFVMAGADFALLISFIVVAVTVGKPLSFLNCSLVSDASRAVNAASAYAFTTSVTSNLGVSGVNLNLYSWAGATKLNCYVSKAIWGFSIALCILFTTSSILLPTLFYKNKKAAAPAKGEA
ncbi:hypothetical protein H2201_006228 [Coniosporium apollinis]|uniref:MARVEL domain-containing protein n=2 Tax=Coniosporium TaxID=2810619 RepID=A0ABQ9NMJ9_9PEZI|nr:hypothetical protein H2199_007925 [Cladosporium sp. JES 115]KAJ9662120.1 hypothetical protein H2201_006228 [Coniosporium apollinis]